MAGLQTQNISAASTRVPGLNVSDKDICVFCLRRAASSASDPHRPNFPLFSLIDCRHYACQPCALVHCDNAGRHILCPQCKCVSRLAQSGRRRDSSSGGAAPNARGNASATNARVSIDDGVSSARSNTSALPTPHRSALKGQSGSTGSKRRANSVQFSSNPTSASGAPDANAPIHSGSRRNDPRDHFRPEMIAKDLSTPNDAPSDPEGRREGSPLTQDALASLPIDPAEARRQRLREQQQRRAEAAVAQAAKPVSLYAITAEPPKPATPLAAGNTAARPSSTTRRERERSQSQPPPKLVNTILEPQPVYPPPPPLVLHMVEEEEQHPVASETQPELTAAQQRLFTQLEALEDAEAEARGELAVVDATARVALRQRMEEAETAIRARRGLELEFSLTPAGPLPDLSDQVSVTSDDELSQRASAHKLNSSRLHASKMRTPHPSTTIGDAESASVVDTPSPLTVARLPPPPQQQQQLAEMPSDALAVLLDREAMERAALQKLEAEEREELDFVGEELNASAAVISSSEPRGSFDGDETPSRGSEKDDSDDSVAPASLPTRSEPAGGRNKLRALACAVMRRWEVAERQKLEQAELAAREAFGSPPINVNALTSAADADAPVSALPSALDLDHTPPPELDVPGSEQHSAGSSGATSTVGEARMAPSTAQASDSPSSVAIVTPGIPTSGSSTAEQVVSAQSEHVSPTQSAQDQGEVSTALEARESSPAPDFAAAMRQQEQEMAAAAYATLHGRESLERDSLEQSESVVRGYFARTADEWDAAVAVQALEDCRRASFLAAQARQAQQEHWRQFQHHEAAEREVVSVAEADRRTWMLSGARADRVRALAAEGDRRQRELDVERQARLRAQWAEALMELVQQEQRSRRTCYEFEVSLRLGLQRDYELDGAVVHAAAARATREDDERDRIRLLVVWRHQCRQEVAEVEADEGEARAIVREEERVARRTASLVYVQTGAALQRQALILVANAALDHGTPDGSSVLSEAPTMVTTHTQRRLPGESRRDRATSISGTIIGAITTPPPPSAAPAVNGSDMVGISPEQLAEMQERQARFEDDLRRALDRLDTAERRVAEETTNRARAEEERVALQRESARLVQEAEQRAEQRIHDARDAAERLTQAQLSELRDEVTRRAEHAAAMQGLAEAEQRAVLETKLQAAERQLLQAEQRAQEELRSARESVAAIAAAEAARATVDAQRREEVLQEKLQAERALDRAAQEGERAAAQLRLEEVEVRAAQAVRLAREEAAAAAAAMATRMAEMERRQLQREAAVQEAARRVRSARESVRDFDSRSQSSLHTSPSHRERMSLLWQQQQQQQSAAHSQSDIRPPALVLSAPASVPAPSAIMSLPASPVARGSVGPALPLAPGTSSAHTSLTSPAAVSVVAAAHGFFIQAAASISSSLPLVPATAATPPQPTPLSAAVVARDAWAGVDPVELIRAAVREAVTELAAAQQRAQVLQEHADARLERSHRRLRRRESDLARAAQDVAAIETSRTASEVGGVARSLREDDYMEAVPPRRAFQPESGQFLVNAADRRQRHSQPLESSQNMLHRASHPMHFDVATPSTDMLVGTDREQALDASVVSSALPSPAWHHPQSRPAAPPIGLTPDSHAMLSVSSVYFDDPAACPQAVMSHSSGGVPGHSRGATRVLFPAAEPLLAATTAAAAHAYNGPAQDVRAPVTMEYSPPPRRSSTRAAADTREGDLRSSTDEAHAEPVVPPVSSICPNCRREDATSTCWRCGDLICRRCGLVPASEGKLCCSAHYRAQMRAFATQRRSGSLNSGSHSGSAVGSAASNRVTSMPVPPPVSTAVPRRSSSGGPPSVPVRVEAARAAVSLHRQDQEAQTSFVASKRSNSCDRAGSRSSTAESVPVQQQPSVVPQPPSNHRRSSERAAVPVDVGRNDEATSVSGKHLPISMIPPSAYYCPSLVQQQPQMRAPYYFDYPTLYANPASVATMTASTISPVSISLQQPPPVMPYSYAMPYYNPSAYPVPTPSQQPQQTLAQMQQQQQQQQLSSQMWPVPQGTAVPSPPQLFAASPYDQQQQQRMDYPFIGASVSSAAAPPTPPPLPFPTVTLPASQVPLDVAVEDAGDEEEVAHSSSNILASRVNEASDSHAPASGPVTPRREDTVAGVVSGAGTAPLVNAGEKRVSIEEGGAAHPVDTTAVGPDEDGDVNTPVAKPSVEGTPNGSVSTPPEPKTERKPAAAAFFVPLIDHGETPRRAKPPTPRNYVPAMASPPHALGTAVSTSARTLHKGNASSRKDTSFSPRACRPLARSAVTTIAHDLGQGPQRASNSAYFQKPTPSPQQQQQRGTPRRASARSPAPISSASRQVQPMITAYVKVAAPSHPWDEAEVEKMAKAVYQDRPSHPVESPVRMVAHTAAMSAPQRYQQPRQSQQSSSNVGSIPALQRFYRAPEREPGYNTIPAEPLSQRQYQQRQQSSAVNPSSDSWRQSSATPSPLTIATNTNTDPVTAPAPVRGLAEVQRHDAPVHTGRPPPPPSSSTQRPAGDTSYYSYPSSSTAVPLEGHDRAYDAHPHQDYLQQQQVPHRYGTTYDYVAPTTTTSYGVTSRHVPTLAELDRRLQRLRIADEFPMAQSPPLQPTLPSYRPLSPSRRAARRYDSAVLSPERVQVQMQPVYFSASSMGYRTVSRGAEMVSLHPHRCTLARRSPQRRTVSPPWRTDLNATPVHRRWDISQPHSPVYHPSPTRADY